MPVTIDTESVGPAARIDYWHRRVRDAFGVDYYVEPAPNVPFANRLTCYTLGATWLSEIVAQAYTTYRGPQCGSDRLIVLAMLAGECTVRHGGRESRLEPGGFCVCTLKLEGEFHFHGPSRYLLFGLSESRLAAQCPDWRRLLALPIGCGDGEAAVFIDSLRSLWQQQHILKGPRAKALADCAVTLLAAALAASIESERHGGSRVEAYHRERIRSFVESELQNSELDIAMIARAVGLSPRYIHRLFANEPLHLMQWVWTRRVERCHNELLQDKAGRRAISEIAYSWGFNDPAHFSRIFRKHFGTSPRDARRQPATAER